MKDRSQRLKILLMEVALCPSLSPSEPGPTTSTITRSTLALVQDSVPIKNSGLQDPRHRKGSLAPKTTAGAQHCSHSLVPRKKEKRTDRCCSPMPRTSEHKSVCGARPVPGHLDAAPTAMAPEKGALSPPLTSPPPPGRRKRRTLHLPSTPGTFEVARELIKSPMPQPLRAHERPPEAEAPVPAKQAVPLKGKLLMLSTIASAPRGTTTTPLRSKHLGSDLDTEYSILHRSWHWDRGWYWSWHWDRGWYQSQEMVHPFSVPWLPQWQALTQWPFWTPEAFYQTQVFHSGRSLSMASGSRYHQARSETLSHLDVDTGIKHDLEPKHSTNYGTSVEPEYLAL